MRELRMARRKPYFIPFGGSTVQGALGYADCAQEIAQQLHAQNLQADMVFCTTGSGGTQAGLVAGFAMAGAQTHVRGISVLYPQTHIAPIVSNLANGILTMLQHQPLPPNGQCLAQVEHGAAMLQHQPLPPNGQAVLVDDRHIGDGYGIPSTTGLEAIKLLSRTEGMLLDPVYTGKAFAGLLAAAQQEQWSEKTTVVFLHSGGTPGLYAYADTLSNYLQQPEPETA